MKTEADEITRLKLQLAQTEALLQQEKLKREAFETMIIVAEKELKISIRKKSGRSGVPPQTVTELNRHHPLVSIKVLCGLFGKIRQAWYDALETSRKRRISQPNVTLRNSKVTP